MNRQFNNMWMSTKDYFVITFGLILYAFGWTAFLLPNEIITGGVTGVASIIYFVTKIPVAVTFFAINAVLLVFAIRILGLQFCLRTIFSVVILTPLLSFFQATFTEPFINGEPFMSCILGSILCGSGIGLVFTANGSTGGTDIIAAIINKYRNISIGRSMLMLDMLIVCSSYLVFQDIEKVVYGAVVLFLFSYACDMVINSSRGSVQFLIFSEKYEEIASLICSEANRGVTILDGMGWYSKNPKKVLVVLAKKSESVTIFRIVKSIDPRAFISQSNVVGVFGEGFDNIK